MSEEMIERLDVDHDLRRGESDKPKMARHYSLQKQTEAKMERGEGRGRVLN
jgi:hypothetical protein